MQVEITEPCGSTQAHWLFKLNEIKITNGTLWKEKYNLKPCSLGSLVITEGPKV